MLAMERAKELTDAMVTEPHLRVHALSVSAAMRAMAAHFGEDAEHWAAIGYLHDYDYERYPEEHLQHTAEPLTEAGPYPGGGPRHPQPRLWRVLGRGTGDQPGKEPVHRG